MMSGITQVVIENKPNWDDAPKWARWLAQDLTGGWWWYAKRPALDENNGFWDSAGTNEQAQFKNEKWQETLEKRP
jgi:hypothetical protein